MKDTTAEGGGTGGGDATQNNKRTSDDTGKSPNLVQQRLDYLAKKKEQAKAKATFATNGGQDTVLGAVKKGVQLTVSRVTRCALRQSGVVHQKK